MAHFKLSNVDIDFQILDAARQRILHPVGLSVLLGGRLGLSVNNRVIVSALTGLTFNIGHGERLGIIGHNGSGKTTLLRLLAGIYNPTRGTIERNGRISTIFDVSLGMDLESTGIENIQMMGLLFGMNAAEIETAIPNIIEFTQLGDYLDLPVRTYSTGMMARLSFAIATARMPDVLLLDEGIGAGDAAFQTRAQARLDRFLSGSNVLVLASHSDELLRRYCRSGLVLERGTPVHHGSIDEALKIYRERVAAQPI